LPGVATWLLSKLDIDVLVTLSVSGPAEADHPRPRWRQSFRYRETSWPESPHALGETLWRANADAVLDSGWDEAPDAPPTYVFEPFPYPITAVEGLKAIACYRHQTADDPRRWDGSVPEAFCISLERGLIAYLPGFDVAPWGWTSGHVEAKAWQARRAAPDEDAGETVPVGADVTHAIELLVSQGIELEPHTGVDDDVPAGGAGRIDPAFQALPSRKVGHWSSTNTYNYHQVQVRAYADAGAAHVGYLVRRAVYERVPDERWAESTRIVARHGRLVVDLARHPVAPTVDLTRYTHVTLQQQRDALALLGEPDESWSSDALPIIADVEGATVAAQGIVLPHSSGRAVRVVTDHEGLQRLAELITDEHVRQQVLDIDPDTHTAVLVHGIAGANRLTRAHIQELASPPGYEPAYLLSLTIEGLRWTSAVLFVIDKLPVRPTEAVLHHPGAGLWITPLTVLA
jgi:hypothetical protein